MNKSISDFAALIESEHPQTGAILLFSLPPDDAGSVLKELSTGLALELAKRIYNTEDIALVITDKLFADLDIFELDAFRLKQNKNRLLLDVLARSGYLKQRDIIRELADTFSINLKYDDIRMIEDLEKVDGARLAEVLALLEKNDLTLALRAAEEKIKEKILNVVDKETADEIRSDLDWGGAVLLDDVAAACERIILFINNRNIA